MGFCAIRPRELLCSHDAPWHQNLRAQGRENGFGDRR